jgi:general secretion pathway protein G
MALATRQRCVSGAFFLHHASLEKKPGFIDVLTRHNGFTLIELLVVGAIITILSAIAVPSFYSYLDKARYIKAVGDISTIGKDILSYHTAYNKYPDNLAQIGRATLKDPWGNSYQYLKIASESAGGGNKGGKGGKGKYRKDRFMVPINTDFDLYSLGRDGKSVPPLTAKQSRDDIIRANNGGYIGYAWQF